MQISVGKNLIIGLHRKMVIAAGILVAMCLQFTCTLVYGEMELAPAVSIDLSRYGLPKGFFLSSGDHGTIIGYRFVVWLSNDEVALGFNTSPDSRTIPGQKVNGSARILVFNVDGKLKAQRDIVYLADGYGEIVADGQATAGPKGTLVFEMQSVNLDKEGKNESKSGVLLLDSNLRDVIRIDRFLEQTTFVDHDLIFQQGFTLGQSRRYDIFDGSQALPKQYWQQDWPSDARSRKFGEHGLAYLTCQQELRPNEYTSTQIIHAGAEQRCRMFAQGGDRKIWEVPLKDGENAAVIGVLADGSVLGQITGIEKGNNAGHLVIWKKDKTVELLPWIPSDEYGSIESATSDMSRYTVFATFNNKSKVGRWIVFDKRSPTPIVDRQFPKNGRAALSPDGLHYASFESGKLHIYALPIGH